ncbi:MAG: aminotransferase class V-fold PLP-dependent enzyme [Bacteroidota bacterium]
MKDFTHEFPVTSEYVYLNTASCGLLSKSLVAWRHQHDTHLMQGGSMFRDLHKAHIREIRKSVGDFFFTSESNVALVPNFSYGLNSLLDGLPKDQKVLLLKGDYPSVNWPIEHRDFEICYAEINENLEQNIEAAMEAHRPNVFVFSVVQYTSGILMDLQFLKKLKANHPKLLLIADGTQFLGTQSFNFEENAIDIIGGSNYKWMLSGYGNAVFMIKDTAQQWITPKTIGFNSADAKFSKRDAIEFVGRLEPGHQDTINYGSLGKSIQFLNELGKDRIEEHLNHLKTKAKAAFGAMGLLQDMVVKREDHSTIFNLNGDAYLFQKLKENGIICSLKGNGIRVSFHIYNTEEDLQKLLAVLA